MILPIKKTTASLLLTFLIPAVHSFQSHKLQSVVTLRQSERSSLIDDTKLSLHIDFLGDSLLLSDVYSDPKGAAIAAAAASVGVPAPTDFNVGGLLQNAFVGFFAFISFIIGSIWLTAAFLVPAGAAEMEKECTVLIPDTWNEYMGKLEEGEELKDRPDLMVELGLLLNKCKADRMEQICVEAKLAPDLWKKYQNMLEDEQELQDRPDFITMLNIDLQGRAAYVLSENTNICPTETWKRYEEKSGTVALAENPILMEELAIELGYPDLLGACIACLLNDADEPKTIEGDARVDATTISGITEIRRKTNQWGEDD